VIRTRDVVYAKPAFQRGYRDRGAWEVGSVKVCLKDVEIVMMKMSNASARNSSFKRSVKENDFVYRSVEIPGAGTLEHIPARHVARKWTKVRDSERGKQWTWPSAG
jgi:hypothetical protein